MSEQSIETIENEVDRKNIEVSEIKLSRKDLSNAYMRWWWTCEISRSFERGQGPPVAYAMYPILRKLFKDDDAEIIERMTAYNGFLNAHATWGGGTIIGISTSLEEERTNAKIRGEETIPTELIDATKVSLMGPLSGIGDSITNATIQYIIISLFLPLASNGNWLGAFLPWLIFTIWGVLEGHFFTFTGYDLGRNAVSQLLGEGSQTATIIEGLSILGTFMMGIIGASYVKVQSTLQFTVEGSEFVLQDILNDILPGMLPFMTIMGIYLFFEKKGLKPLPALIGATVILGGLAFIGIL